MKKRLRAAALSYFNKSVDVPVVDAFGEDDFAKLIIQKAKENGVKIVENEEFFDFHNKIKVGKVIPPDIYEIVAEILSSIVKEC